MQALLDPLLDAVDLNGHRVTVEELRRSRVPWIGLADTLPSKAGRPMRPRVEPPGTMISPVVRTNEPWKGGTAASRSSIEGAVQLSGLGLEMRGVAGPANQDAG